MGCDGYGRGMRKGRRQKTNNRREKVEARLGRPAVDRKCAVGRPAHNGWELFVRGGGAKTCVSAKRTRIANAKIRTDVTGRQEVRMCKRIFQFGFVWRRNGVSLRSALEKESKNTVGGERSRRDADAIDHGAKNLEEAGWAHLDSTTGNGSYCRPTLRVGAPVAMERDADSQSRPTTVAVLRYTPSAERKLFGIVPVICYGALGGIFSDRVGER
jgi:hypothetical protein